jgi:hypothetical protein
VHSYDHAKRFAKKFTHVSPVWLTLEPDGNIKGVHDVDQDWIEQVRNAASAQGSTVKIVPRVYFGGWAEQALQALKRPAVVSALSTVFVAMCQYVCY